MAESLVQVTEGAGKKLHTWSTVVGANTVEDEYVIPGEVPTPSYFLQPLTAVSVATINDHVGQLMAGASLKLRIRRIYVQQAALATTVASMTIAVMRLSTAGTGGTAITARPHDTTAAAAGGAGMSLPTVKGTEGVELFRRRLVLTQTLSTAGGQVPSWEWDEHSSLQPIIVPAGTANGICLKVLAAHAAATIEWTVEFTELAY
jgi:hypothetical protein